MRRFYSLARYGLVLSFTLGVSVHGQSAAGQVAGVVLDPAGHPLPDAAVTLEGPTADATLPPRATPSPGRSDSTRSDATGRFAFEGVDDGLYALTAARSGYAPRRSTVQVNGGRPVEIRISLDVMPISEVVDVVASTGAGDPLEQDQIRQDFLRVFQLPTDRFQEALPLLPGVIRDPRGRISFNGSRPSQSALLVNGANATDPVTGQFAAELPLSAVDTIEIHQIPYSAEFGRISGAVANVRTIAGDDHWGFEVGSLMPQPRFRDGGVAGINSATPRVSVNGPIARGRAWLNQSFSYRFVRSRVEEEVVGDDEQMAEGFDSFTQIDLSLGNRHAITGTVSFFGSDVENLGIDSLNQADATPDLESDGWNLALANTLASGNSTVWRLLVAVRGYDVAVRPKHDGPAVLTPDGLLGNYFNHIERQSHQVELHADRTASWMWNRTEHLTKVGGQLLLTSFNGFDRSGPIETRGADGRLLRRTTFDGSGLLKGSDRMSSLYVQDHWRVHPRVALDLGLRYDQDAMLSEGHLAPRAAFSLDVTGDGRTMVKGGFGVFFDRVLLQVDDFERSQRRIEQAFDGSSGMPLGPPVTFENQRDRDDFDLPKSRVWNLELDRQINAALMVRLNYRDNRAHDRHIIDRVIGPGGSALVLSSSGEVTGREFDATLRWTSSNDSELFVSFSKIRTTGDTNDFAVLYDNQRSPLLLANEEALEAFEVPNRLLVWGVLRLPGAFTLTPGIEWRNGFSYTVFTEDYSVVDEQNDERLPTFLSIDMQISKTIALMGRNVDLGLQIYNLTGHHNARETVSNLASPSFGSFRNSVGRGVSLKVGGGF